MEGGVEYRLIKNENLAEAQVLEQHGQQSEIRSSDPLRKEDHHSPPSPLRQPTAGDPTPLGQSQRGILRSSRPDSGREQQRPARSNRVTIREMETTADEIEGKEILIKQWR